MTVALVIDTSALLTILLEESDAVHFASALVAAPSLLIAAPTLLEANIVIATKRGDVGVTGLTQLLTRLNVEVVACDSQQAQLAFEAWLAYGKGRHPASLNFGDCFAYALAKLRGVPLLFKGNDFAQTDVLPWR